MKTKFRIKYDTEWGESLTLVFVDRKCPMRWTDGGIWETITDVSAADLKDYTYNVVRDGVTIRPEWEHHSSRPAKVITDNWIDCPIPGCRFTRRHKAGKFDRPGFRGAGTVIPVFSLRSEDDFGIGDFRDLHQLVDWAASTGQTIIQLLPINDTTRKGRWADSYPYSPVSSFGLHPLYIRLQDLGIKETAAFKKEQAELNALTEIDWPRVFKAKMTLIRKAYETRGAKDLAGKAYNNFYKANAEWLGEYAEFCAIRDNNEPEYHAWIQYHLDKQLSEEAAYARGKGISFKGDLPIGVSGDSADAYWHPELFNLDSSAGAPPDFFSADGQNWGFPTYNWEEMAKDGYAWWKARLRKMSEYFDAFRIDHILGFFRIWEIPAGKSGKDGHFNPALAYSATEITASGLPLDGLFNPDPRNKGQFQPAINPDTSSLSDIQKATFAFIHDDFYYHRNNEFWRRNAEKKLPALLDATGMLACGEDLGMVPDCVPDVMYKERILSLEMPCMEKGRPWPELSVCAISSHDMGTLRMQKEADPEPWECLRTCMETLTSASMLAIFPLQDWISLSGELRRPDRAAERINEPADPNHHWRYRMHLTLEHLNGEDQDAKELRLTMEALLKDSGRWN